MDSIDELSDDLDDSKVLLTIEEDEWNGVCHPDIESEPLVSNKHGAPFNWRTSGDPPAAEEVGERFGQEFEAKVDAVYELIDESDEPLDAILDLEPDDLVVSPDPQEVDE